MLLFAHLGIGHRLVQLSLSRWMNGDRALSVCALAGTVAPDVLDKTSFLISNLSIRPPLQVMPFFSGTRTVAHSLIFVFAAAAIAGLIRSRRGLVFSAGMLTHLVLDCFNWVLGVKLHVLSYVTGVLFWPFLGWEFPIKQWTHEHFTLSSILRHPAMWLMEGVGIYLLSRDFRRR